jgi:selenocysteine lyase/cysteine desulfurase
MPKLSIDEARRLWSPAGVFLNTASFGLPPRPAWNALQEALADWRHGRTSWEHWCESTERARHSFARLVGVAHETVAIGGTVSGLVGLVASSLPDDTRVLSPDIEFPSALFPFLAQAGRGVEVTAVPFAELVASIDDSVDVVVTSAVQMSSGEVIDLGKLEQAAVSAGAMTVLDATQACGWLPLDAGAFDIVVCTAYKWLMSPRGTAFMTVRPERLGDIVPQAAGWYAGEDVYDTYSAPPLRLASSTRRLDVSPAWFSWVGTAPTLELLEQIGIEAVQEHDVGLANRFRAGLGLPPGDSAIVSVNLSGAAERLNAAGIMAAVRDGRLRASFHLYNTSDDVDAALDALRDSSP